MYRYVNPASQRELLLRMLFQPAGDGLFLRACEADSFRALVAAMVDDPTYLNQQFIRTYNFKKQPDASGWEPTPCLPR